LLFRVLYPTGWSVERRRSVGGHIDKIDIVGPIPSSQLVEVASNSPVYFFSNSDQSAIRMVLEGIIKGQAFRTVSSELGTLPAFRSGQRQPSSAAELSPDNYRSRQRAERPSLGIGFASLK
jgi:hypothetical protein